MTRGQTVKKIQSFSDLPIGWAGDDGGPISKEIINSALDLLRRLPEFENFNAICGADDSISIIWKDEDLHNNLEVFLSEKGELSYNYFSWKVGSHEFVSDLVDLSFKEAVDLIDKLFVAKTCK